MIRSLDSRRVGLLFTLFWLTAASPALAGGLDVRGWLDRPGVKLLAVEFYATWCEPCMKAVPRWKELHDRYRKHGLRLVVVATQDPEGGCTNPGWNPDDVVCDDSGTLAKMMRASSLPAAFLWSWQGNLLVRRGHVDQVEAGIQQWMRSAPRAEVRVAGISSGAGIGPRELRDLVRNEVGRSAKLTIVASADERARLSEVKKASYSQRYDEESRCELGKELSPNSLLEVNILGKVRKRLRLGLLSVERGCLVGSAVVHFDKARPEVSVAEAIAELTSKLRPEIQMPGGRSISLAGTRRPRVEEDIGERFEAWDPGVGQERVIVSFASDPPGAVVLLNGELLCQDTSRGCSRDLPKGTYSVTMQRERYKKRTGRVRIDAEKKVLWKLRPNFGTFAVTSDPPGLELKVEGKTVGRTPVESLELGAGRRELLVSDPCYFDRGKRLQVRAGESRSLSFEMRPRMGAIDVVAVDASGNAKRGQVWVDGRRMGTAPGVFKLPVCAKQIELRRDRIVRYRAKLDVRERKLTKLRAVLQDSLRPVEAGDRNNILIYINEQHVDTRSNAEAKSLEAAIRSMGRKVAVFSDFGSLPIQLGEHGVLVVPELERDSPAVSSEVERSIRTFVSSGGVLITALDEPKQSRGPKFLQSVFGWSLNMKSAPKEGRSLKTKQAIQVRLGGPESLPHNNDTDALDGSHLPPGALTLYASDSGDPVVAALRYGKGFVGVLGWDWYDGAPLGQQDGGWRAVLSALFNFDPSRHSGHDFGLSRSRALIYSDRAAVDFRPEVTESEAAAMQAALLAGGRVVTPTQDLRGASLRRSLPGHDILVVPDLEKGDPRIDAKGRGLLKRFVSNGGVLVTVLDESGIDRSLSLLNQTFGWRLSAKSSPVGKVSTLSGGASKLGFRGPARLAHNYDSDALAKASFPAGTFVLYRDRSGNATVSAIRHGDGFVAVLGWDWYEGAPLGKQDGGWMEALHGLLELDLKDAPTPKIESSPPQESASALVFANPAVVDLSTDLRSEAVGLMAAVTAAGHRVETIESMKGSAFSSALAGKRIFVLPELELGDAEIDRSAALALRGFVEGGGRVIAVLDKAGLNRAGRFLRRVFGFQLRVKGRPKGSWFAQTADGSLWGAGMPAQLPNRDDTDAILRASLPRGGQALFIDEEQDAIVATVPVSQGWVSILGWDWYDAAPRGQQSVKRWQAVLTTLINGTPAERAVQAVAPQALRRGSILFMDEPRFVDMREGNREAEGANLRASLARLGFPIRTAYLGGLRNAYQRRNDSPTAVVIPELVRGDERTIARALRAGQKHLKKYVSVGGTLVVVLDSPDVGRCFQVLSRTFRWRGLKSKSAQGPSGRLVTETADALRLSSLPRRIPVHDDTDVVLKDSLPARGQVLYADAAGNGMVSVLPYKRGRVVILGWDWYDAAPVGSRDGGWLRILEQVLR